MPTPILAPSSNSGRQTNQGAFQAAWCASDVAATCRGSATCGKVAATGFNDCLDDPRQPLPVCFNKYVTYAGLRACDAAHPCREDYICVRGALDRGESSKALQALIVTDKAGKEAPESCGVPDSSWQNKIAMGTCIPPYFVLQFRADKHNRLPK